MLSLFGFLFLVLACLSAAPCFCPGELSCSWAVCDPDPWIPSGFRLGQSSQLHAAAARAGTPQNLSASSPWWSSTPREPQGHPCPLAQRSACPAAHLGVCRASPRRRGCHRGAQQSWQWTFHSTAFMAGPGEEHLGGLLSSRRQ